LLPKYDPSYSSVADETGGGVAPPKAKAAVCVPIPPGILFLLYLELGLVQVLPSYSSVAPAEGGVPPKANAAV
jgi:hypothetical protein